MKSYVVNDWDCQKIIVLVNCIYRRHERVLVYYTILLSHPVRVRELKQVIASLKKIKVWSHPVRVRELKPRAMHNILKSGVASRAGAGIETPNEQSPMDSKIVASSAVRELK